MKTILAYTICEPEKRDRNLGEENAFLGCGANTGNVCFVDALREQVKGEAISCYKIIGKNDGKTVFVLPAANWINLEQTVLQNILFPLENEDIHLAVVGIGIQYYQGMSKKEFIRSLHANYQIMKALRILSEHSNYIGVRGYETAECLHLLGIDNTYVIGCPSFYEPYRKSGGVTINDMSLDHPVINVTPGKYNEHVIIEWGIAKKADFILQSMNEMPRTIWENYPVEKRHIESRFPGSKFTETEYCNYIRNQGRIFYTRNSWTEYLKASKASISIGTRFHGNMMALSNGIPALWIMHDVRTRELIEFLNLPYLRYDEIQDGISDEVIVKKCMYTEQFQKSYHKLAAAYIEFLNKNNIEHTFYTL